MINLIRNIEEYNLSHKKCFCAKVVSNENIERNECNVTQDLQFVTITTNFGTIKVKNIIGQAFEAGEVIIINTPNNTVDRFYRPSASANSILLTEKCDQRCIMCSQPPKNIDYDYFDIYENALLLTPKNTNIGITGGEPTLHKENLFKFIIKIIEQRPDITFHVLSNGQHIKESDINNLRKINEHVLWGIPLYSCFADIHDKIVVKPKAFNKLMKNLNYFYTSASRLELRTVILKQNINDLYNLSELIVTQFPWIEIWAIMQLEQTGYATQHWDEIFYDSSENFNQLTKSLNLMHASNVNTALYNFPLCTVPKIHRKYALSTISDWKNKYIAQCSDCTKKDTCGGFFEWYNEKSGGFKNINPIR